MALIIDVSNAISMLDNLVDDVDAGTTASEGSLLLYDDNGAGIPADTSVAITTQILVADCPLNNPSFGAASDQAPNAQASMLTATAVEDTNAAAGDMSFFRIIDRDDNVVMQGTVGTSGADINFNTVTVAANDTVTVTALDIVMPEQ